MRKIRLVPFAYFPELRNTMVGIIETRGHKQRANEHYNKPVPERRWTAVPVDINEAQNEKVRHVEDDDIDQ